MNKEEGSRIANKEEGSRMDVCGGCATKGDARQRHATTGNVTTSRRTRGKWEERCQWTRGDGASIGQGCAFRGGGRVETMRGGGINTTTNGQRRDFCSGGKRERKMVADDIIGALGMENETIDGVNGSSSSYVTHLLCVNYTIFLDPGVQDALIKRRYVSPWCEDDSDTLGLGVGSPWAMIGKSRHTPWSADFSGQWCATVVYVGRYVGLV